MTRASERRYAAAVEAIYRAAAAPELWSSALEALADEIGASGGMLVYHSFEAGQNFMLTGRLRDDLTKIYLKHHARNIYAEAFRRVAPGRVHVANRLVDAGAVRRSSFHADILAPQRIENLVVAPHARLTRRGTSGGVAFTLSKRQNEEVDRVATRFQRLAPHVFRAVDLTLQFGQSVGDSRLVERILDAMPSAAMLLDRRAVIVRTNGAADALLRQRDGAVVVRSNGPRLAAQIRPEAKMLSHAIAQALAVARGEECRLYGPVRITRPSGAPPLLALITPLPPAAFSLWEAVDGGGRVLVQIVDPSEPADARAGIFKAFAGLTATEARVAAHVGADPGLAVIAAKLGVSTNTVKTHLKRVFDKTGFRSQGELARFLASIPARAPSGESPTGSGAGG